MTLDELQAKYEGVLLCAPLLAAEMADMVQDERADERSGCIDGLKSRANDYDDEDLSDLYYRGYKQGIVNGIAAICNRSTEELD